MARLTGGITEARRSSYNGPIEQHSAAIKIQAAFRGYLVCVYVCKHHHYHHQHLPLNECMYAFVYVCVYICLYAYMYVCVNVYVGMRVFIGAYVCVYVYVSECAYMNGCVTCMWV